MDKHFNTAGPGIPELHYLIDPLTRINVDEIESLIEQRRYFVLLGPPQCGKTTCLQALRDHLMTQGRYTVLHVAAGPGESRWRFATLVACVLEQARRVGLEVQLPEPFQADVPLALQRTLDRICRQSPKPIVMLLDDIDALDPEELNLVLRQLRTGYTERPQRFPQSIVLCGVHDVRDHRGSSADGEISGNMVYNISAECLRLADFTRAEVAALYAQDASQQFTPEALELAWTLTCGQPWLVNALAAAAVGTIEAHRDGSALIDADRVRQACAELILQNDAYLDRMTISLRDDRIRRVIEPLLIGDVVVGSREDFEYAADLGLLARSRQHITIASPIHDEAIWHALAEPARRRLRDKEIRPSWLDAQGKLAPRQFLLNFLDFWREHGEVMMGTVPYHEAAPHLVLMAYLQRVVNGAGRSGASSSHASCAAERAHMDVRTGHGEAGCAARIEREYAAGSGRLDLLLVHGESRMAIEVKRWRPGRPDPLTEGLEQIERYLARLGLPDGYLVIFDQRPDALPWEQRMQVSEAVTASGKPVLVLRG